MAKKPITRITVEWEGWPWQQFGEEDEKEGEYRPSGFLRLLLGLAYLPFVSKRVKNIDCEVETSSITISGYKATIEVIYK